MIMIFFSNCLNGLFIHEGYRYGKIPWNDADLALVITSGGTPKLCLQVKRKSIECIISTLIVCTCTCILYKYSIPQLPFIVYLTFLSLCYRRSAVRF